jgi:hypothetical protein
VPTIFRLQVVSNVEVAGSCTTFRPDKFSGELGDGVLTFARDGLHIAVQQRPGRSGVQVIRRPKPFHFPERIVHFRVGRMDGHESERTAFGRGGMQRFQLQCPGSDAIFGCPVACIAGAERALPAELSVSCVERAGAGVAVSLQVEVWLKRRRRDIGRSQQRQQEYC